MLKSNSIVNTNQNLAGEYVHRINRVIDYIEKNIDKSLSIEELADVANFSRFHFQRLFGIFVGESLYRFILRIRLEKAASLLISNPKKSITEIAIDCGFSGSSTFARAFKDFFKISASEFRNKKNPKGINRKTESTIRKTLSNVRKDFEVNVKYFSGVSQNISWSVKMNKAAKIKTEVKIEELESFTVAYIRHIGAYKGNEELFGKLFDKLCTWAGPRDLIHVPETKFLTVYHDNCEITEEDKLRISVCISVPKETPVEGEIGKMEVPGGKYAVGKFEIFGNQYQEAWDCIYGGWLPNSGYQLDDRPCFELYLGSPEEHPEKKHVFKIYAPVKPL